MKIAVFCSANKHIDPDFFSLTEEFSKHTEHLKRQLHTLLFHHS